MHEEKENTGVSKTEPAPEAIVVLREVYRLLDSLDGVVGPDGPAVSGFRDALDILYGRDAVAGVFHDADEDEDDGSAESEMQAMLAGTADLEATDSGFAALSLKDRRVAKYFRRRAVEAKQQEDEKAEAIADGMFKR